VPALVESLYALTLTALEQKAFCFPLNSRPSEAGESKPEQQPANRLGAPDGIPEFPEPSFEGSVLRDWNRVLQCSRKQLPTLPHR
jgi:hypothetical protein